MIVERAEHPTWTSNAYLVADEEGGHGVLVDSNGVEAPLLAKVAQLQLTITHVLVTHQHGDHVVDVAGLADRFGVPTVGSRETADAGVRIDETIGDGTLVVRASSRSGRSRLRATARGIWRSWSTTATASRPTVCSKGRSAAPAAVVRPAMRTSTTRSWSA